MTQHYEIIVIGAGPAGMAASQTAAKHGAKTLVLDEQRTPGGQIYRAAEANEARQSVELGKSYENGFSLVKSFRNSAVDYVPGASVWQLSHEREIGYSKDGTAHIVTANQVIVATGALERPMPVPGWTLPQVMTVGAAQILLKESEIGIADAVFVGTGPLLYLVVHQYITAGIPVKAVIDLTPACNYFKALAHMPNAVFAMSRIMEGWRWKREIIAADIPLISRVDDVRILGDGAVEAIEYRHKSTWKKLDCDHVLLHQGVVPDVNISLAAGCDSRWDEAQACWHILVDEWFQSSVEGISIAGDSGSIGGGVAAEQRGHITALGALMRLNKITPVERNRLARPYQASLKTEMQVRPFLDTLFRPADNFRMPEHEETIVCRCEEISAKQIREAVDLGCQGPNQLKSYTRCGMGPCQGRFCGLTVSELIGKFSNKPVCAVGYYRLRPPIKPLLLDELANMKNQPEN